MRLNRIQKIEDYVNQHQTVSLDELCEVFEVSKNTIRRDINYLADKNALEKVYGGVVANSPGFEHFDNRDIDNHKAKINIAYRAAELIKPNDIVYIDSGTTTKNVLSKLDRNIPFTLVTNSLDTINLAVEFPHVDIIIIGTTYKRSTRSFVVDMIENPELPKFNIDIAFMAATGFSINIGLTNSDPLEHTIKKHIVERSQTIYLLADNSKIEKTSLYSYASLDSLDGLITNSPVSQEYINYFNDHDIELIEV